jgi:phage terminase large subunit-like protein
LAVLTVPRSEDDTPWPTLGPLVCDFIETYLVYGPGDLLGVPVRLTREQQAFLYRMYEIFPQGHPNAGKRRFRRCALSLRKGTAKTEFAAFIAACELHPDGPVRFDGWDGRGEPKGRPVTDPYIPLVAYTQEQTEDLAYGALKEILERSPLAKDLDIGLTRIMRRDGAGIAQPLAAAPSARDGARTTFQHFDETHRMTLPNLKSAHKTMMANLLKRPLSDPWSLETTTAPEPGAGSIAEDTMNYARSIESGKAQDARLFFFHRQANEKSDLDTREGLRAAVVEASGPSAEWSDIDGIVSQWDETDADPAYLSRVWLNMLVKGASRAFDVDAWKALAKPDFVVPDGDTIVLGFDGSRLHDATALVASHVRTGFQWVVGLWECPPHRKEFEVPVDEVDNALASCFERWNVWRLYADPPYWDGTVSGWAGEYGDKVVIEWRTNRYRIMAAAIKAYVNAIANGEISHDGDPALARHLANSYRRDLHQRDEEGKPLWIIQKERPDSIFKIDAAMASILADEARRDALASGVIHEGASVYETRGLVSV